jgi:LysM repeat protein
MNNQSPLVPLGSLLEQKNKGRTRVKIAVSFVLIIHGIGLLALLVQGCHKDEAGTQKTEQTTTPTTAESSSPQFQTTNTDVTPNAAVATANPAQTEPPRPAATPDNAAAIGGTEYTIVKGDYYSAIATRFHLTVKALEDANPGIDPKKLQIGKKIHIPPQPLPTATGTASTGTPGTTTETTNGEKMYTVKSGDMLITIAKANGTTVKAIKAANPNLTSDSIKVGQKLKIPARWLKRRHQIRRQRLRRTKQSVRCQESSNRAADFFALGKLLGAQRSARPTMKLAITALP